MNVLALAFGPFRLHLEPLRLCRQDDDVRLGGRALALLHALVARAGDVCSRSELEAQVWPYSVVEDSSLRVHVAALRRALGDGIDGARYIANVPGRGYSFVAPVSRIAAAAAVPATAPADAIDNLPTSLIRLIGRDAVIATLKQDLALRRLVSIVGHGGIGKTSLALAVAAQVRPHYPGGVCFVDLAPLTAPDHVIETVAANLGLTLPLDARVQELAHWLRPRRLLLILDNCEHLLDAVTGLVERMLRHAPGLVVLTTSRRLSMQIVMVRVFWMQGQGGRATALAAECVRSAEEARFPAALSQALCLGALPVALWQGDDAHAGVLLQLLATHLDRHPQQYWTMWLHSLRQVLALRAAPAGPGAALAGAPDAKLLDHLATFGAWSYHDKAMGRWRNRNVGWSGPELLRIEGELLLRRGADNAEPAAAAFTAALALAEQQQAHGWGLRAANSLARLRLDQGWPVQARAVLAPWLARLDAMGASADAADTRALLEQA